MDVQYICSTRRGKVSRIITLGGKLGYTVDLWRIHAGCLKNSQMANQSKYAG